MESHKQTEIEESLLPQIDELRSIQEAKRKRLFIIIFASFFVVMTAIVTTGVVYFISNSKKPPPLAPRPTVVMVSLDGFRWDYLDIYNKTTPNMNRLRREGTYSTLRSQFPSKTFPNHYTLATGLYPESHGIVSNTFYDPVFNEVFSMSNQTCVQDAKWWGGEPIWVSAENAGVKAGIYFWPGSEAPIKGVRPTYYKNFNGSVPMTERVAGVIQWMELPESERPNLIGLYMEPVDTAGHNDGPISQGVADATAEVDAAIGQLLDYLNTSGKLNSTNFVIVSDHGMTLLDPAHIIYIDDCINISNVMIFDWSPNAFILPNDPADTPTILAQLNACQAQYPNMTAYLREDIPAPFVFNDSIRITPILVIADLGWSILRHGQRLGIKGNHGYDNRLQDMQGIFLAHGPNVKPGHTVDRVPNLDVYNLITHLLHIPAAPNNGTMEMVHDIAL